MKFVNSRTGNIRELTNYTANDEEFMYFRLSTTGLRQHKTVTANHSKTRCRALLCGPDIIRAG